MSFADLKKSSGSAFDRLTKQIEKLQNPSGGADERFWKPELDKSSNGYAVIRFLPEPNGEDLPWAQVWSHAFQGTGGWYIENSLTTLNKKDPVGELNRTLWNSGIDSDKEVARKQKRKLSYYSNIYVIKDPLHPENEGKIFLFKYGKKIWDKIAEKSQPQFEDEQPINVFDFWKGADFKLKIVKKDGYWNYDKSEFSSPSVLNDLSDEELESIWKKEYSLKEFSDESNFKTYEQLQERLNIVLGKSQARRVDRETQEDEEYSYEPQPQSDWAEEVNNFRETQATVSREVEEDDDNLSYFARLAEED
jgi:hypothetical protein